MHRRKQKKIHTLLFQKLRIKNYPEYKKKMAKILDIAKTVNILKKVFLQKHIKKFLLTFICKDLACSDILFKIAYLTISIRKGIYFVYICLFLFCFYLYSYTVGKY